MTDTDQHDALSCPQCQGMAHAAKVIGSFAESMQRKLDDGTFERLGRKMAERQNDAFWKAFLEAAK